MKRTKKIPRKTSRWKIFATILAAAAAAAALSAAMLFLPRKPKIAFYRLPDSCVAAIESFGALKIEANYVVLDPNKPLSKQIRELRTANILFAYDGLALRNLTDKTIPPVSAPLTLMPTAMREGGQIDGMRYGVPVLLDHFALEYNRKALSASRITRPKTLEDLEVAARSLQADYRWPITCAGADDRTLLLLVGALMESMQGKEAEQDFIARTAYGLPFSDLLNNTALESVLERLSQWRKDGLIHPNWTQSGLIDVQGALETESAPFAFMTLSDHRTLQKKAAELYAATPVPSARTDKDRSLASPAVVAVNLKRFRKDERIAAFQATLLGGTAQATLAGDSGLVPVNSTAKTADKQAADVRLWIAGSSGPMANPADDAFDDPALASNLAASIRSYLETH